MIAVCVSKSFRNEDFAEWQEAKMVSNPRDEEIRVSISANDLIEPCSSSRFNGNETKLNTACRSLP